MAWVTVRLLDSSAKTECSRKVFAENVFSSEEEKHRSFYFAQAEKMCCHEWAE